MPLLAVQDGLTPADVDYIVGAEVGLAIGGTTMWKECSAMQWGDLARRKKCYLHMLRVNTKRRINICHYVGCDSFDGTSATQFPSTIPKLTEAARLNPFGE